MENVGTHSRERERDRPAEERRGTPDCGGFVRRGYKAAGASPSTVFASVFSPASGFASESKGESVGTGVGCLSIACNSLFSVSGFLRRQRAVTIAPAASN